MVRNYMETLVNKAFDTEFLVHPEKYGGVCRCPGCVAAMKAYALNCLPPFYTTTLAGDVFGEYQSKEMQNMSDVLVAVGKGIEAEGKPPGHPEG